MHNRCSCASVIALGVAFALQPPADAQRGGGAGPVRFPTSAQFAASGEAQKRVAAARRIAGTDLVVRSAGPRLDGNETRRGTRPTPAMTQAQVGRVVGENRGPEEWTEFASPEDRFTCNFPGRPAVTDTTWASEFGAQLKGRLYDGRRGNGRYQLMAIDYSPIEAILTARAKACPTGAETCRGGADTGVGYWKNDVRGAVDYAAWKIMQRPGVKLTHFMWNFQDMVAGKVLHLTNPDGTRTFVSIYFHDNRLIVMEGRVPEAEPEPGLFQQSLGWLDETGRGIRYATVYYADPDLPKPALHQRSFISDFGRIDATGIR